MSQFPDSPSPPDTKHHGSIHLIGADDAVPPRPPPPVNPNEAEPLPLPSPERRSAAKLTPLCPNARGAAGAAVVSAGIAGASVELSIAVARERARTSATCVRPSSWKAPSFLAEGDPFQRTRGEDDRQILSLSLSEDGILPDFLLLRACCWARTLRFSAVLARMMQEGDVQHSRVPPPSLPSAPLFGLPLNCSSLTPMDMSPKRSPLAVHNLLSAVFSGRDVVEAGTRYGDGLNCWGRTARSAIGMEYDKGFCKVLQARFKKPQVGSNVSIMCRSFYEATPDADVYTLWQQTPQLGTDEFLRHLTGLQRAGQIRPQAEAVLLFEMPHDQPDWDKVASRASWRETVAFDEVKQCLKHPASSNANVRALCRHRGHGQFVVAGVRLSRLGTL